MAPNQRRTSEFKFTSYTDCELKTCGDKFLESCKSIWNKTDSEVWTEHVLEWFSHTAPEGIRVDARLPRGLSTRDTQGEWLVDLVHTSYPPGNSTDYWRAALEQEGDRAWSILLALESEWGKPGYKLKMILDDTCKLTALRAAVKVLVTSVSNSERGSEAKTANDALIESAIIKLRQRTRDTTPWLWINLPNADTPERCRYVMFGDRNGTVRSDI